MMHTQRCEMSNPEGRSHKVATTPSASCFGTGARSFELRDNHRPETFLS